MSTPAEPGATWASRPLGELLDVLGSRSAPVGGGSAAALAAAMAAALLERCATEAGADGTRVRSANLRRELVQLVDTDAAAVVALMQGSANGADQETTALLAEAASAPMRRLCERAHELGALADRLERDGPSGLRGEARCARLLARAAGEAASAIIEINGGPGDAEPAVAGEAAAEVVDLAPSEPGSGPRWGMQSEELNATLLT